VTQRLAKKVLLVGWDAADWMMIRPLIEAGAMPTLAGLIESGVSGNLATIQPILSPLLWTSIATGKRADKHGICGFVEPLPDGSGIRPVNSTSRKTKAIWNILSQNGFNSNVVGWFATHPAEPIRGAVVSDYYLHPTSLCGAPSQFPEEVCHPARLKTPLINLRVDPAQLDAEALLPFVPKAGEIDFAKDRRVNEIASLLARTSSLHAAACALMANEPWDFMAVYYDAIDQFGHHFMPYHPPHMEGISPEDAEMYQEVMTACYRFHDMMLEALLDLAGKDATILLVSDHGFHSGNQRKDIDGFKNPTSWHRQQGIACVHGPGIKPQGTLQGASLLDVAPTILSLLGLPLGNDMDGRPWLEIFDRELQPERIESWDSVPGDCGSHSEDRQEDTVAAVEALRHLVDLGYIAPPSDDIQTTMDRATLDLKTNLAIALSDGDDAQQAMQAWQEVIAIAGSDATLTRSCQGELARCYMRLGQFGECERILNDLLADSVEDPSVRLRLAQLKIRCRQPKMALNHLKCVQGPAASSSTYHSLMGQAYMQLHQLENAEAAYRKVLEIDREHAEAWAGLAQIAMERRDFQVACEYALEAVGLEHHLPAAHLTLGLSLAECGYCAEAIHALETSLGMAPRMIAAHERLAELLIQGGRDVEKAQEHQRIAQQLKRIP